MSRTSLLAALLLALPGLVRAELSSADLGGGEQDVMLEAPAIRSAVRPAYRIAEGVSDRLYGLISLRVFLRVLPSRLNEDLFRPPEEDSYALFGRHFQRKQRRFMRRMHDSHPRFRRTAVEAANPLLVQDWQRRARHEQVSVLIDVFRDTLLDRYQLLLFRDSTRSYARDIRRWEPSFIAAGATIGSGFLYYNGMHATMRLGGLKVGLDLASGRRILKAMKEGSELRHAAGLELAYKGLPLTFSTDCGMKEGRLRHETLSLKFHKPF